MDSHPPHNGLAWNEDPDSALGQYPGQQALPSKGGFSAYEAGLLCCMAVTVVYHPQTVFAVVSIVSSFIQGLLAS